MLSAVTSFFFVRITRWVVPILYFSPLRNSFVYTSRLFFYFNARHLLKNIFHYASPYCVYSLACHLLRWMFQYTSRSWISNSMHVTCCVQSLVMRHGWFHSVIFHRWIAFICLSQCPTLLAHDNFPHSAYGQKQKKEGRHQEIETLTGERTRNR